MKQKKNFIFLFKLTYVILKKDFFVRFSGFFKVESKVECDALFAYREGLRPGSGKSVSHNPHPASNQRVRANYSGRPGG